MTSVNDLRRQFIEYFHADGHEIVPSSPLVPRNDPTLMFVNSGMVQFKNIFTGAETRPYNRAVTSQKCVRAGGKHNDLDNVGYTARHHTFFEMLGNFSFGDYFKDHAIEMAWNFVTRELGLNKSKLYATVYIDDDEAYELWKNIAGLPSDRIIRIATNDNFWMMGPTGPCGPSSEIFYDHGDHIWGGPPGSAEEDGDRFIEIWNLVFMQFEQLDETTREALPKPSIDTGMGLERIAALLQGTHDNYGTDLFRTLIGSAGELTKTDIDGEHNVSLRVIADHLRSMSFLINDGVLPSNEGRGYVLRRIMRRAMRHAHLLKVNEPVLYRLVSVLVGEMGQAYPDLSRNQIMIEETISNEEERFLRTLSRGIGILEDETKGLVAGDVLEGSVAFKLYDTYGFPLDLTEDALRSRDITVDQAGFDEAMQHQKEEARRNWSGSGDTATETIWLALYDKLGPTEFLGYGTLNAEAEVKAFVKDGENVAHLQQGDEAQLIVNQTPFYGESGGQVGDTGVISLGHNIFTVTSTLKKGDGIFVHYGHMQEGSLSVGDAVALQVDTTHRHKVRANHSATHLIHEALRRVLGDHVHQKGSLVAPDRLRFDFGHNKPVSASELTRIERLANQIVLQNGPVETRLMAIDDAINSGAMALFGEKYGDEVRVVTMGHDDEDLAIGKAAKPYSIELCGGTHVSNTGEIGLIKLVQESSTSAGVRRVEALTGHAAREYLSEQDDIIKGLATQLKVPPHQISERVMSLIEDRKSLEKALSDAKRQLAMGGGGASGSGDEFEEIKGIRFMGRVIDGLPAKELRSTVDAGKSKLESGVVVVIGLNEGKAGIAVGVTDDLTDKISAVELVRIGSSALGGKGGGGRPDMAQAGGPEGDKADQALDEIRDILAG